MTISKDLLLSNLAMGVYNGGQGTGIADGIGPTDANGGDEDGLGSYCMRTAIF